MWHLIRELRRVASVGECGLLMHFWLAGLAVAVASGFVQFHRRCLRARTQGPMTVGQDPCWVVW